MRILAVALALIGSVAAPLASSAEDREPARPAQNCWNRRSQASCRNWFASRLSNLIPSARAAECTEEGETCTSNEQCCPGLECSRRPSGHLLNRG